MNRMTHASRVAPAEHDLLTVARALVGEGGFDAVAALLRDARRAPERLGPTAMRLLGHTLAAGAVRALVRRGGWRRASCLRPRPGSDGSLAEPVRGRLWERHDPPALDFGPPSLALLSWLVAAPLGSVACPPLHIANDPAGPDDPARPTGLAGPDDPSRPAGPDDTAVPGIPRLGLGDELLLLFALDLTAPDPDCARAVAAQAVVARSALCRLAWPERFAGAPAASAPAADAPALRERFGELARGDGAVVLEGLERYLARRWIAVERRKPGLHRNAEMQALGQAEEAVLGPYLDAIDLAGRRDLAGFLLDAARVLTEGAPRGARWVEALEPSGPLRERTHARRAAAVLLRAVGRLRQWDEQHRAIRFFDDEYDTAQHLLRRWEALGAEGFRRVEAAQQDLEALVVG